MNNKQFIMAALALIPLLAGAQNNNSGSLCPDSNHPHVIDLGLPSNTKWACCNVGSMKPEDYGSYFAWGETSPKSRYDWSNYSWCRFSGNSKMLTKYNPKPPCGTVDNRTQLELSDDAAHVNWGGNWRLPTKDRPWRSPSRSRFRQRPKACSRTPSHWSSRRRSGRSPSHRSR